MREWNAENKERVKQDRAQRWIAKRTTILAKRKVAYAARTPEEIEAKRIYMRDYMRNRLRNDLEFRLLAAARNRLYYVAKGTARIGRTVELLGCTPEALISHIEKQFQLGWTWKDWGPVFEIDHIRPCSSYDLTDPEQKKACFHYKNLQPLLRDANRRKWNKWKPSIAA